MTRQLELLRPGQIAEEIARCPRVWLPLGTIEYHSKHCPWVWMVCRRTAFV